MSKEGRVEGKEAERKGGRKSREKQGGSSRKN